jgi:CRISPR-associated endonuclease/helicase Cas3
MQVKNEGPGRVYYAHSRPGEVRETWERLEWHLRRAGAIARRFGRSFGADQTAAASGLLHDVGKYSDEFQRRLAGDASKVDHSTGGAKEALARYDQELGILLAYGIAGHHGGLPNGGIADDRALLSRLQSTDVPRGHDRWKGRVNLPELAAVAAELTDFVRRSGERMTGFSRSFLARMIFSCLVDADFLATEWFYDRGKSYARRRLPRPTALAAVLRAYLDNSFGANPAGVIDRHRAAILVACRGAAPQTPGVFSLHVPTGGGKTLSSLSFALEHAAAHGLDRVVYAIPYTSIIEQTADVFRAALSSAGSNIVVEHHSAAEIPSWDQGEEPIGAERLRLATENWDAPLVVTTTVQLFDSLYANRPSRCRKLHNLARSVIVLDEVQALPLDRLTACLATLRELTARYRSSLVLCSATMPDFATDPSLKVTLPAARPIVMPSPELSAAFRRVASERIGRPIDDEDLANRLAESFQVLCIVDARLHAAELFALLPDDGSRFHLSAAMCPAHRRQLLNGVKERLVRRLPCRLVATRVIEAGVDISFPVVWRAMAGVDSLAQAAGRCNRNGELEGLGRFVVFEPAREDAIPKPLADLRRRAGEARQALGRHQDPLSDEAVRGFFTRITALDPSDLDRDGCWKCLDSASLDAIPFRGVADDFQMITDATRPLIVRWGDESASLIDRLCHALNRNATRPRRLPLDVLRQLQAFTVGCYNLPKLKQSGDATAADPEERFHVLENSAVYRDDIGLDLGRMGLRDPEANLF